VFKEVRLPLLNRGLATDFMLADAVDDTFLVYLEYDDCYDETKINALYKYLPEGNVKTTGTLIKEDDISTANKHYHRRVTV
jgi:hypothetical protein